jgi:hypothetical protein
MPYPNQHAGRVADPDQFSTCRTKKLGGGISLIICKKKGSNEWKNQAYRFDKRKFTVDQAKKWLKDHDVKTILFEPAEAKKEGRSLAVLKKIEDVELANGWNDAVEMFRELKAGKDIGLTKEEVVDLGALNLAEIMERNKVTFDVEGMEDVVHELIVASSKEFVDKKLRVEKPHGDKIFEGKETALLLGKDEALGGYYLLVQGNQGMGFIRFGAMPDDEYANHGKYNYRIDSLSFDKYKDMHQVTNEERTARWEDQKFLWLYPIQEFFKFEKPIAL